MTLPIVSTLVNLLRIESITGNDSNLLEWIDAFVKHKIPSAPRTRVSDSLVVHATPGSTKPKLALLGHLDTVPGDEFGDNVRVEEQRVIGLGASDMKSGLAVMLHLLDPALISASRYDLTFIFYAREEGPHDENDLHKVLEKFPALKQLQFAFILEPTNNDLHLGCMGVCNVKVNFSGRRAHSARPWTGENAIQKAGPFLTRLAALAPIEVQIGDLTFKEVCSATLAKGGIAVNVVPDDFEINLNVRFAPGTSVDSAQERIRKIVGQDASVEFLNVHPSGPIPQNNPIFEEFRRLHKLKEAPKQAYTDVGLLGLHGIDAVNLGPGLTDQAHQKGEYVRIGDLVRSFELFRNFLFGS